MERPLTTIDLRGSAAATAEHGFGVLTDPTGRRGRTLRRAGRVVAALFAIWLTALALAGVGLLPSNGIPLASRNGGGSAPPPLAPRSPLVATKGSEPALQPPAATGPTAAAATPTARPAPSAAPAPTGRRETTRRRAAGPGRRRSAPTTPAASAPAPTSVAPTAPGRSAAAPGKSIASPGHSGTAPGQTRPAKTPAAAAPAPTVTPTPSHGRSESAPGRSGR